MRQLLPTMAVGLAFLAACADTGASTVEPDLQTSSTAGYRVQLTDELSAAGLSAAQTRCAADGILADFPPETLAETEPYSDAYFDDVNTLEFGEFAVEYEADDALYNIVVACGVNLRSRALEGIMPHRSAALRECISESVTETSLRDHWTNHFNGFADAFPSELQRKLETSCDVETRSTAPESASSAGGAVRSELKDEADRLASMYGYTLPGAAVGEGAALAEVTCARAATGWDYESALSDDLSVGAPRSAAIGWNGFVYEEFCPAMS